MMELQATGSPVGGKIQVHFLNKCYCMHACINSPYKTILDDNSTVDTMRNVTEPANTTTIHTFYHPIHALFSHFGMLNTHYNNLFI